VELSDAQLEALKIKLSEISGKVVDIVAEVDPALLGGVLVEMDGKQYDGSIRAKLHKVKEVIGK
jgi:F-type H+-transporting ATPase subunit delta